jgi:hypothetical protein
MKSLYEKKNQSKEVVISGLLILANCIDCHCYSNIKKNAIAGFFSIIEKLGSALVAQ